MAFNMFSITKSEAFSFIRFPFFNLTLLTIKIFFFVLLFRIEGAGERRSVLNLVL